MRDDYLSADWARSHRQFSDALSAFFHTVSTSLKRLNAIQYEAPWKHEPARR